jgi:hypothetical protein
LPGEPVSPSGEELPLEIRGGDPNGQESRPPVLDSAAAELKTAPPSPAQPTPIDIKLYDAPEASLPPRVGSVVRFAESTRSTATLAANPSAVAAADAKFEIPRSPSSTIRITGVPSEAVAGKGSPVPSAVLRLPPPN